MRALITDINTVIYSEQAHAFGKTMVFIPCNTIKTKQYFKRYQRTNLSLTVKMLSKAFFSSSGKYTRRRCMGVGSTHSAQSHSTSMLRGFACRRHASSIALALALGIALKADFRHFSYFLFKICAFVFDRFFILRNVIRFFLS